MQGIFGVLNTPPWRQPSSILVAQNPAQEQVPRENEEQHRKSVHLTRILNGGRAFHSCMQPCQKRVLKLAEKLSRRRHDAALKNLQQQAALLGFTSDYVERCLQYIRDEAPVVIHITETTLSHLVQDSHYRNVFVIGKSGGCSKLQRRAGFERNLFGRSYNHARAFDRPKYGCLNVTSDVQGVPKARAYGNIILTLGPSVRSRAAMTQMDSSSPQSVLATLSSCAHILSEFFSDEELQEALAVAQFGVKCKSSSFSSYTEVQIHGPVCLATDVQGISIPRRPQDTSKETRDLVEQFRDLCNCGVVWQSEPTNSIISASESLVAALPVTGEGI